MRSPFLLLPLLACLPYSAHAQTTLQSAHEILNVPVPKNDGMVPSGEPVGDSVFPTDTPLGMWQRDARAFRKKSVQNSPAQNAKEWLALAARRMALPSDASNSDGVIGVTRPEFRQLVAALPSPASWPEILKQARAAYTKSPSEVNATNLYLAARLQNDAATQTEALRGLYRILGPQFEAAIQKYPAQVGGNQDYQVRDKARRALQRFDSLGALLVESPSREQQKIGIVWKLQVARRGSEFDRLQVPDLVGDGGEAVAKPLLREILLSPKQGQWYNAGKTVDLARRMWMADAELQRIPQWNLASSARDPKFALAMVRKFPHLDTKESDLYLVSPVRGIALGSVLKSGQFAEATRLVEEWIKHDPKNSEFSADEYVRQGVSFPTIDDGEQRAARLKQLSWIESTLKAHPQMQWWDEYRALSVRLGETPRRLKLLQTLMAQGGTRQLPRDDQNALLRALSDAYLDSDDAKSGGDILARALQSDITAKQTGTHLDSEVEGLLHLTRVVPNADWMKVAQSGARLMFASNSNSYDDTEARKRARLALQFAEQKQVVFAGSLLGNAYRAEMKSQEKQEPYARQSGVLRAYLFGLMGVYKMANRPADMVYLLEHASGWDEKELTPLLTYNSLSEWDYSQEDPDSKALPRLGYLAAWGLAKTNRRAEASQITRALIERLGGYDPAYQLLCDLEGQKADAFLQQQAARDRFEERPLIWRGVLARRAGKFVQAQKFVQAAIAIDPSDGEEGRGDRLRAYAELGLALRGQGKKAEAEKVEGAVRSIRLAETADMVRIAGLTTRAVGLYKRSLGYFDNAYCVQSRLAVQLVGLGRYQEAATHFRRAYELMPQSFGRLESHCFGCEGVFGGQGKPESSIARQVFLQLEKARPNDPKVAYLSGYWRSVAGQNREAVRYFQRAVALDPLYLSAWRQLSYQSSYLTPAQSDRATLKLIELDPRGIHDVHGGGVSFAVKGDYKGLWKTTEAVLPIKTPRLKANFPLPASRQNTNGLSWNTWDLITRPSDAIANQDFVTQISVLTA